MTDTPKSCNLSSPCCKALACFFRIAEFKLKIVNFLSPLIDLGIRLWLANIFWKSGTLKLPAGFLGIGKGNWDSTLYLFTYEHPIPFLAPSISATMGTFFEVFCPILLFIGLGVRPAAAILLIMTAFIEFTYLSASDHQHWMLLCAVLLFHGGGKLSLDYLIRKKSLSCPNYRTMVGLPTEGA